MVSDDWVKMSTTDDQVYNCTRRDTISTWLVPDDVAFNSGPRGWGLLLERASHAASLKAGAALA